MRLNSASMTLTEIVEQVQHVIDELKTDVIPNLPTLAEIADADMALMYLRHLKKELDA